MAPSNGTQERQLRQPRQSCSQWRPAMAASNGTQERQQQWHPGTAATTTSPSQWHPAMAPRNGSYDNLAKVASQWDPAMAPRNGSSNGTQKRQLRQPHQKSDPPCNHTQQWHPGTAATTTSPKLRPNGTQQWHPGTAAAMAPRTAATTTSPKV